MSGSLRVDSAAVRAAASRAGSAAATATPGSAQVRPCASDMVSVAASTRFGSRMALARQYAAAANAVAAHYGVKLSASAEAYDRQEDASAALLGGGDAGVRGAEDAAYAVSGLASLPGLASTLGAAPLSGAAPGEVPESPRDIARLIETGRGGAGKQTWQAAEASLHREARELDDAADQMGAGISAADEGWQSSSAYAATAKMRDLQSWYRGHADYVRGLAREAQTHVQNFTQATATIPSYKDVVAGERELQNAVAANARSGGRQRAAVVHAQVQVSQLYQASTTGFSGYTAAEAMPSPQLPTPPPGLLPDSSDAGTTTTPGDGKINTFKPPAPSPSSAPVDPVAAGNGVGQDLSPGATFPVGATDPAAAADPLVDALPDTAGSLMPQVIPGLIGGVVGGLGGALGGLAGAGQKAVQSMGQAAGPLMNELGQHPPSGDKPQEGEQSSPSEPPAEPASGGEPSTPDVGGGGDGGGGGEMEPAGGAEPMAAPPDVAPTPAVAAPAAAAAPPEPAPATGMGMGPMMAPPMGAGGGRGSGPDVKELYRDRKLKVVAPPNSEPVKNRREGRERKKEKES